LSLFQHRVVFVAPKSKSSQHKKSWWDSASNIGTLGCLQSPSSYVKVLIIARSKPEQELLNNMKPHHSQNSLLFISKLLAFSLVHGHERFSFLKCDTWYYVLCSWRGLKIRTSFLLRWWNLFMSFQSDSLVYSFKDHLCKRQHLSWTNQNNIQISHHARKAR
jgi:hypothetical protein